MLVVIVGATLVVASIVLFAWAIPAFRNPAGPAWRERYLVLELLACVIVGTFFFGLALLIEFALRFAAPVNWALSAAILVGLWPLTLLVWRVMRVKAKVAAFEAAAPKVPTARPQPAPVSSKPARLHSAA